MRRVVLSGSAIVPCTECGRDVRGLSLMEAAYLLDGMDAVLMLVASGTLHGIETVGGTTWICRDSVFRRRLEPRE